MIKQFHASPIAIAGLVVVFIALNTVPFYEYILQTRKN